MRRGWEGRQGQKTVVPTVPTIKELEFRPTWLEFNFPKFILVAERRMNLTSRERGNTRSPESSQGRLGQWSRSEVMKA